LLDWRRYSKREQRDFEGHFCASKLKAAYANCRKLRAGESAEALGDGGRPALMAWMRAAQFFPLRLRPALGNAVRSCAEAHAPLKVVDPVHPINTIRW
jgi:hypothetical protein